jgi:hypothetical protein
MFQHVEEGLGHQKYKKDLAKLRKELYETIDDKSIPLGIQVLWDFMRKPRLGLFGPDYTKIYPKIYSSLTEANALLRSGASSVVFKYNNGKAVLKVGIHPSDNWLAHKVKILCKLGCNKDGIDKTALPVLIEEMKLSFKLGDVPLRSQGLVLSPKGRIIECFFSTLEQEQQGTFLDRIIPTLVEVLKATHLNGVFHNDVSPRNIIVQGDGLDDAQVFLVDFGYASDTGVKQMGLLGT